MSITTMLRATKKQDEWMTPDYAVKPLLSLLPKSQRILCPFDKKDSAFVRVLSNGNHNVYYSHINERKNKKDFFDYYYGDVQRFDCIISNPPYSLKDEVFEKLVELDRPFAMLMGATAGLFEGKRFNIFKDIDYDVSVVWLKPRVAYIDQAGEVQKSPPFQSCYVCYGMKFGSGHIFMEVEK